MWARASAGGSVPWRRHTTMGLAHTSHSATQHTSSSWYQGVIFIARQRSQPATLPSSDGGGGADAMAPHLDHSGDGEQHEDRRDHEHRARLAAVKQPAEEQRSQGGAEVEAGVDEPIHLARGRWEGGGGGK